MYIFQDCCVALINCMCIVIYAFDCTWKRICSQQKPALTHNTNSYTNRDTTIEMFFGNTVIKGTLTHLSRYRPPTFHVQAWYDEVKDYTFPYPQECNPYCPFRCSGPVCTHYTQVARSGSYHFVTLYSLQTSCFSDLCFSWAVLLFFCSWYGPPAVGSAVPSTCATIWMCGDRFGPKLSISFATIHQSKQTCCDVLSFMSDTQVETEFIIICCWILNIFPLIAEVHVITQRG